MRGRMAAGCVLAVCALALTRQPAAGQIMPAGTGTAVVPFQTPVSVSTPTATPSVPSGQDLLDSEQAAVDAQDTFHVRSHSVSIKLGKLKTIRDTTSDIALHENQFHTVSVTKSIKLDVQPHTTTTDQFEWINIQNRSAVRNGPSRWQCATSVTVSVPQGSGPPGYTPPVPRTVGSRVINGEPVWQVRVIVTIVDHASTSRETLDYFITKSDRTLLRTASSGSIRSKGRVTERVHSRSDFSRYGAPLDIRLPSRCRRG